MRLLILGGTADGRKVVEQLRRPDSIEGEQVDSKLELIYSVAGLVRVPSVGCEVVSGGFSQFGGLRKYIEEHNVTAILDCTHPYAATMSCTAVEAAEQCAIPCWRFHRPAWQPLEGDEWRFFESWEALLPALVNASSVFITAGQISQAIIDRWQQLLEGKPQKQLLRTAVKPSVQLPDSMQWIKAIGPFNENDETALMQQHNIDLLVSKNSGGDATVAKLTAARKRNIPVLMLERPPIPDSDQCFDDLDACIRYVCQYVENR
jgi:precorrin-6A/cobalt-precorrin-6A reductase